MDFKAKEEDCFLFKNMFHVVLSISVLTLNYECSVLCSLQKWTIPTIQLHCIFFAQNLNPRIRGKFRRPFYL